MKKLQVIFVDSRKKGQEKLMTCVYGVFNKDKEDDIYLILDRKENMSIRTIQEKINKTVNRYGIEKICFPGGIEWKKAC